MANLLSKLASPFATIFSSKMTEEFTDKSIKNVPFSGKRADYEKWAKRFLSYAQMKKVKQILLGKEKPPSTTEILEMQVKSDLSLDSKGKNDVKMMLICSNLRLLMI